MCIVKEILLGLCLYLSGFVGALGFLVIQHNTIPDGTSLGVGLAILGLSLIGVELYVLFRYRLDKGDTSCVTR